MNDLHDSLRGVLKAPSLPALFFAVRKEWESTGEPDALALFNRQPELLSDKYLVLDLVGEEFCQRRARGEVLNPDRFAAQFSCYVSSIRNMLISQVILEEHDKVLHEKPEPVNWPSLGETVGDLTLVRELGRGAFARVFLATEASTGDRPIVVKLSSGASREAQTLGPLSHPHIVPVWSARRDQATRLNVVCMPYRGEATLANVLDTAFGPYGAQTPASARVILNAARVRGVPAGDEQPDRVLQRGSYEDGVARLLGEMASALAFLHARGICHRDLKPSNVLLSPDGQALLLDFNLSDDPAGTAQLPGGTVPYMAPEHLRARLDKKAVSTGPEADVYALGVIAHELLTGRHPFGPAGSAATLEEMLESMLRRQAAGSPPLRSRNPRVGRGLAELLNRCLAADETRRPTAAELERAASRYGSASNRLRRWTTQRPLAALCAALMLALGVVGGVWGATAAAQAQRAEQNRVEARTEYERGRALMAAGDLPNAYRTLQRTHDRVPDGRALACMAYCKAKMKHHAEAVQLCDEAIAHGFQPAAVYNNRGYSRMMVMQDALNAPKEKHKAPAFYTQAADDFRAALRLDAKLYTARHNLVSVITRRAQLDPGWVVPPEELEELRPDRTGPPSAALAWQVAWLFGRSSRPEFQDDLLHNLQVAIDLGRDPKSLVKEKQFAHLHNEARFKQLHQQKPNNPRVSLALDLLDPLFSN